MPDKSQSWSVPVGRSELITVYNGTKQILSYQPDHESESIVDVTIVEKSKE